MNRTRTAAIGAVLAIALAACGSATPSTPLPSPTLAPSPAPSHGSSGPTASTSASPPSADRELEALIPDEVGGVKLEKTSMKGSEVISAPDADPSTVAFLNALGLAPSDIGVAFGFGFSADSQMALAIFVFRASGADQSRLVSVFKDATNQSRDTPLTWQPVTLGGRSVEVASDTDNVKLYLYAKGDILFLVSASGEAQVAEALGKLP